MINHRISIFGYEIDLMQDPLKVLDEMKTGLNLCYPVGIAQVISYSEINERTIEVEVRRSYKNYQGLSGCLCNHDMSLISGLDLDCFDPYSPDKMVFPLIPWYDNMFYCPESEFYHLWKMMQVKMVNEQIQKIKITPCSDRLIIRVIF